jgi:hypothetical protein
VSSTTWGVESSASRLLARARFGGLRPGRRVAGRCGAIAARAVAARVAFWGRGGMVMALTDRLVLLYALYSGSLAD